MAARERGNVKVCFRVMDMSIHTGASFSPLTQCVWMVDRGKYISLSATPHPNVNSLTQDCSAHSQNKVYLIVLIIKMWLLYIRIASHLNVYFLGRHFKFIEPLAAVVFKRSEFENR